MMTAVLAVLSIVTIPLPTGVPVTLQTFAMAFCGYVLGWKLGGASSALYLDLRKYGSASHAGFGLGFERCVMYLTGMGNIRDVIPFPRTVKNCEL